jgi:hypothetical protein
MLPAGNVVCRNVTRGLRRRRPETRQEDAMLDAYVIEEIKRRERDKRVDDRPVIELPLPAPAPGRPPERRDDEPGGDRGVVIIDYSG